MSDIRRFAGTISSYGPLNTSIVVITAAIPVMIATRSVAPRTVNQTKVTVDESSLIYCQGSPERKLGWKLFIVVGVPWLEYNMRYEL